MLWMVCIELCDSDSRADGAAASVAMRILTTLQFSPVVKP